MIHWFKKVAVCLLLWTNIYCAAQEIVGSCCLKLLTNPPLLHMQITDTTHNLQTLVIPADVGWEVHTAGWLWTGWPQFLLWYCFHQLQGSH